MDDIAKLRFNILRNAIYHSSRWRFLDMANKLFSALVILAGAAAVGDIGATFGIDAKWLAAIATFFGTFQLVFDLSSRARVHEFLQKRFFELAAEVEEAGAEAEARIAKWEAALRRLYSEEPPPMRVLNEVAHNAAMTSMGRSHEDLVVIPWWQTLLKNVWAFNGTTFRTVREMNQSGA